MSETTRAQRMWFYGGVLSPPTDERPFFFNQLPFDRPIQAIRVALDFEKVGAGVLKGNALAGFTLLTIMLISAALVVATIVVPLRPAIRDAGASLVTNGTMYFVLIGIGFMMVEIGLLQRISVFLGHPVYSLSIVLFSLILATGVGSLISDRIQLNSRGKLVAWSLLTSSCIFSVTFWLPHILAALESAVLFMRAGLAVAVLAPMGLLMGFGFPTGMRLVSRVDNRPTPWFWGINGAAGVLASSVAVLTSIAYSIDFTLRLGALCYLMLILPALGLLACSTPNRVLDAR